MAAGGHHAVGPGLPELVALMNLVVVIAVVYFAGRRAIKGAISQRSSDVAKGLLEAREELALVEARLQKAKSECQDIEAKKREVMASVRTEGERIARQIVEETQKTAQQILTDAELTAASEVKQAAQKIRSNLVEQTFAQTLAQLEGSAPKARDQKIEIHDKLFEKFVNEIPQQLKSVGGSANGS